MTSQLISERASCQIWLMILFWSWHIVGPLTTAATVLEEAESDFLILVGMNFTILTVVMKERLDGDDLSATILSEAMLVTSAEEDDDDI